MSTLLYVCILEGAFWVNSIFSLRLADLSPVRQPRDGKHARFCGNSQPKPACEAPLKTCVKRCRRLAQQGFAKPLSARIVEPDHVSLDFPHGGKLHLSRSVQTEEHATGARRIGEFAPGEGEVILFEILGLAKYLVDELADRSGGFKLLLVDLHGRDRFLVRGADQTSDAWVEPGRKGVTKRRRVLAQTVSV
jgi:hypothetical protein